MTELTGPRQVVIVTCRDKGKDNAITLAWHMPTSFNPPLYTISVGTTRLSHDMIKNSGSFCVNFMSEEERNAMEVCGSVSGRNTDKFEKARISKEDCEKIDCPRIKQALGFLECKVVDCVGTGDHTIFVGEVLKSGSEEGSPNPKRLYHLGGMDFTTTADFLS